MRRLAILFLLIICTPAWAATPTAPVNTDSLRVLNSDRSTSVTADYDWFTSAGLTLDADIDTTDATRWDTAYTDRLKWDGGATGLTAGTGRTSLGLGTMATQAASAVAITGGTAALTTATLSGTGSSLTVDNLLMNANTLRALTGNLYFGSAETTGGNGMKFEENISNLTVQGTAGGGITLTRAGNNVQPPFINLYKQRGTLAAPTATADYDHIFLIQGYGRNASGVDTLAGYIALSQDGPAGAAGTPGRLSVAVNDGSWTTTPSPGYRLLIDHYGNTKLGDAVFRGYAQPTQYPLTIEKVKSSDTATSRIILLESVTGTYQTHGDLYGLIMGSSPVPGYYHKAGIFFKVTATANRGKMYFSLDNNFSSSKVDTDPVGQSRMSIDRLGNVLIGTGDTTASTRLTVDGAITQRSNNVAVGLDSITSHTVTYADSSPKTLFSATDGMVIQDCWVQVTTAFDGTGPSLDIGDEDDPDGFVPTASVTEGSTGFQGMFGNQKGDYLWNATAAGAKGYTATKAVKATIGGTGMSQGAAVVWFRVARRK